MHLHPCHATVASWFIQLGTQYLTGFYLTLKAVPSGKKRRVQIPFGASGEDDASCEPPEWRMELTRDGSGENISPDATESNDNKEKCSPDGSGKSDGKSGSIK